MDQIKYTFLLPAYKPDFFEEALRSIKSQTYSDFKVLVSDDCSPHDLKSIYNKVCGDDARFSYRRNEVNMGSKSLVSHWNLLVDMCDTEYLILASDDDVYEPTFLEEVDKLASKYPEVDLIRARVRLINEKGETLAKDARYEEKLTDIEFISQLYGNHYIKCIANFVFKTKKLQVINGFKDFPLAWNSDSATVIEMSRNGIANTNKLLFSFRNSTVNISYGRNDKERCFKKLMASFEYDNWFGNYIRQKKQNLDSMDIYYKYQMSIIEAMHDDAIKDELYTYISGVSFFNLLKIMHRTKSLYKNLNCFYLYLRGIV
nr:glycosyltransferase family 2 protein [uncultured Prevotella sp.]